MDLFAISHSVSYIITTVFFWHFWFCFIFFLKDFVPASLLCDKFEFDDVIPGEALGWLAAAVAVVDVLFFDCIVRARVVKFDNFSSSKSSNFEYEWLINSMSGALLSFKRAVDIDDASMTVEIELAVDSSTTVSSIG